MEAISGIAILVLLLLIFSSSGSSKTKTYERKELGLSVNENGNHIVFHREDGQELYEGTLEECNEWITRHTRQ